MRRRHVSRVLVLAVVLACAGAVGADDALRTTRVPMPHPIPDETYWYGVYQERGKVGWGLQELKLIGEGDDAVYVSRTKIEATLERPGQRMEFEFEATDEFRGAPPFEFLRSLETRREGDSHTRIRFRRTDDGYAAAITVDGEETTETFGDLDYTLADRLSPIHWAMKGLKRGDRIHVREFNLSKRKPDIFSYEVRSVQRQPAHGMLVTTYTVSLRSRNEGALGESLMGERGRVLRGPFAGVAEMRLEGRRQAVEPRLASKLFEFGHAPATEPLGDPKVVKRMTVAVYGRRADLFPSVGRQVVHRNEELNEAIVRSGEGVGHAEVLEDADRPAYLAATDAYPKDDPALAALAAKATKSAVTDRERAYALVRFVDDFLVDVHIPEPVPVRRLLDEPMGDAADHARLLVTLARAVGLPARTVTGLVYVGDDLQAFGGHTWCEVALDGRWHPVDPAWGETSVDGTHLALAWERIDATSLLAVTDRLSFEIRDVEYGG